MAKVLFIENKLRTDKLGILYLAGVLKSLGHTVDMIQDAIDPAVPYVEAFKPDVIMYSVQTGEHQWALAKNRELKQKYSFISVFGGPHFTFFADEYSDDFNIDYVVQGPGELVIGDIVVGTIPRGVVRGPLISNPMAQPYPAREILYKYDEFGQAPMKRFITMRDCYNACTYCFNHLYHRLYQDQKTSFFARLTPERIIAEIINTMQQWPLKMVYFNDDDLCCQEDWLKEFLISYKKWVHLPFCGSVCANTATPELLERLSDAGCTFLNIAVESAVPETQKLLRRGNISNEQIQDAVATAQSWGIKIRLQNMIGLPVEDPLEDAMQTLAFNYEVEPFDSWAAILQPYPGTDIWKLCCDRGLIRKDMDLMNFYEDTVLSIPNRQEINALHKWWYFAVRHRIDPVFLRAMLKQELKPAVAREIQEYRWRLGSQLLYNM